MLVSYGRPTTITWTITSGTFSPAFELDAAGDSTGPSLSDSDPQVPARFGWRVAAPATTDYVDLIATYSPAITVRVAGLFGVTLPVGTIVQVRDASSMLEQEAVIELPNGERVVWFELSTPTSTAVLKFRIYNDDGTSSGPTLASGEYVDIGEAWFGQAQDVSLGPNWSQDPVSPEVVTRSVSNSLAAEPALTYRRLTFSLTPRLIDDIIDGTDLEALVARLNRGQFSVFVPVTGTVNEVMRTAQFGKLLSGAGYSHSSRRYFQPGQWVHEESPSPPA